MGSECIIMIGIEINVCIGCSDRIAVRIAAHIVVGRIAADRIAVVRIVADRTVVAGHIAHIVVEGIVAVHTAVGIVAVHTAVGIVADGPCNFGTVRSV